MKEKHRDELVGRLLGFISRKLVIAVFILVVSTYMVLEGHIEGNHWLVVVSADILGYDFSNALAKKRGDK